MAPVVIVTGRNSRNAEENGKYYQRSFHITNLRKKTHLQVIISAIPPFRVVFFRRRNVKFAFMNDTKRTLTDRDLEILRLIAQGCTSPQIAEKLSLSPETIKWYRKRLLSKLEAENTAEMIRIVSEKNLI